MSTSLINSLLLVSVTFLYAGYNLFIKMSGNHVPDTATTTVVATICLQIAALFVSLLFLICLFIQGGHSFRVGAAAYQWAFVAGICIGLAEVGYFYLFSDLHGSGPMDANVAIPVIVSGTIALAMVFSFFALKEQFSTKQLIGCFLFVCGIVLFFIDARSAASG